MLKGDQISNKLRNMIAYRLKEYSPSEATSGEAYNWLEETLSEIAVANEATEELLEEEDMTEEEATKGKLLKNPSTNQQRLYPRT